MQTTHTAHPRSRGENEYGFAVADKDSGSSPLTRGKLGVVGVRGPVVGLIPAHAGKTSRQADKARVHEAHPRSRGENKGTSEHTTGPGGSSPLTRGKRLGAKDMYDLLRLIPAHAGKTRSLVWPLGCFPAHPRSRGENPLISSKKHPFGGSSPLTRGKRNHYRPTLRDRRLIPAHAGKTAPPSGARVSEPAHPRSRGENFSFVSHDGTP